MRRFRWMLPVMLTGAVLAGCGGPSKPEPLAPEQERQLQEQMRQVQEQERARAAQPDPAPGPGG